MYERKLAAIDAQLHKGWLIWKMPSPPLHGLAPRFAVAAVRSTRLSNGRHTGVLRLQRFRRDIPVWTIVQIPELRAVEFEVARGAVEVALAAICNLYLLPIFLSVCYCD